MVRKEEAQPKEVMMDSPSLKLKMVIKTLEDDGDEHAVCESLRQASAFLDELLHASGNVLWKLRRDEVDTQSGACAPAKIDRRDAVIKALERVMGG